MDTPLRRRNLTLALVAVMVVSVFGRVGAVPLDVDADGAADVAVDGQLLIRHLFGFAGDAITDGLPTEGSNRTLDQIRAHLQSLTPSLDVDGDGQADALSDGILILRHLSGYAGSDLIDGALSPGATRTTASEIAAFVDALLEPVPLVATIEAVPQQGASPLQVGMSAVVTGGDTPYSYAWDFNGDSITDATEEIATFTYAGVGSVSVGLTVVDVLGQQVAAAEDITLLAAPIVAPTAAPSQGGAPLEVALSANVADIDGDPVLFEWDFEADGSVDWSSTTGAATTHTYVAEGRQVARLRVTDNDGLTVFEDIEISVGVPPTAVASAEPISGAAPLAVTLNAGGSDADGSVATYEWDLDGDGTFDVTRDAPGAYTHQYQESGTYLASLRVTDDDGLRATDTLVISVAGRPEALPGAYPRSGEAPLSVSFFADGRDLDGSLKFYDWDFDGDGTVDEQRLASMTSVYTYTEPGSYSATLTVTDDDGLTGSASIDIEVSASTQSPGLPLAVANASPSNGGAPLEVLLTGMGRDDEGEILLFEWDLDGDGAYDWQEAAQAPVALGLRIDVGNEAEPVFHDLDADGDLDLVAGGSDGRLYHYENVGDSTVAQWRYIAQMTVVSEETIDVGYDAAPVLGDLDADADPDLLVGSHYGTFDLYVNTGTPGAPAFEYQGALLDPSEAPIDIGYSSSPALLDADGDGDLDLISGASGGELYWVENLGSASVPVFAAPIALEDDTGVAIELGTRTTPTVSDLDNDGIQSLLVGADGEGVYRFSVGMAGAVPTLVSQGALNDIYGNAVYVNGSEEAPVLADIDADGDLDLFIGNYYGNIDFYDNLGDATSPSLARVTGQYNYPDLGSRTAPSLLDFDDDGDLDLLVGASNGALYQVENRGDANTPRWYHLGALRGADGTVLDIGADADAVPFDLNRDGRLDLLVGESYGRLAYCLHGDENWLSGWDCSSGYLTTAAGGDLIDIGSRSKPALADIDLDGDLDLFIGEAGGNINLYRQRSEGGAIQWDDQGSLVTTDGAILDIGDSSDPVLADLDGDRDLDLLVGGSDGVFHRFINDAGPGGMAWRAAGTWSGLDVGSYASPALGDLDGDGDLDLLSGNGDGERYLHEAVGSLREVFEQAGFYAPRLRVTDDQGNTATDSVQIQVAAAPVPQVYAVAFPSAGIAPLSVELNGGATPVGADIVLYEWDFDGDGSYDASGPAAATQHVYATPGNYLTTLRATDSLGRAGTASVRVEVGLQLESSGTTRFTPGTGGTATITTTLNGPTRLRLQIVDAAGGLVRTLVDDEARDAGEHNDVWDGRDDAGEPVRDGAYYYVIEYLDDGEWHTIDLREAADYAQEDPARSWNSSFNPFAGEPAEVSYELASPAEVTLYFWTRRGGSSGIDTIDIDRTLILREPRDAGSHTEIWDGVDDKRVLVESGVQYPMTLWAYTLPENAIIVAGNRPELNEVSADPVYFNPAYNPYAASLANGTAISYRSSKAGSANIRVLNDAGEVVVRRSAIQVQAGLNRFVWDGKTLNGQPVAPGPYSVEVVVIDASGNRSMPRYAAIVARY